MTYDLTKRVTAMHNQFRAHYRLLQLTGDLTPSGADELDRVQSSVIDAIAEHGWDEGYARGVRDSDGELDPADNPIRGTPIGVPAP